MPRDAFLKKIFKAEGNDKWIVPCILLIALFACFHLNSNIFGWGAFQERDFARACDFVLGKGLSHIGPEVNGGGNIPGPALTLLFALPALIFKSPRGVFVLTQLSFLLSAWMAFLMVKRNFKRSIAYLFLAICLSNYNYVLYAYSGWHACLILPANVLVIFLYEKYLIHRRKVFLFLVGIAIGCGIQFHFTFLALFIFYILLLFLFNRKDFLRIFPLVLTGVLCTFLYYFYFDYSDGFVNTKILFGNVNDMHKIGAKTSQGILGSYLGVFKYYSLFIPYISVKPTINMFGWEFCTGWISYLFLFTGVYCIFKEKYDNKKRFKRIVIFLLLLVAFPVYFKTSHARYLILAHPAFEVLLAVSLYFILKKIKNNMPWRWIFIAFLCIIFVLNISLLFLMPVKYVPVNSYSIYSNYYFHSRLLTGFLIDGMAMHPDVYKKKFYSFRGKDTWLFMDVYTLPSDSHYELAYEKKHGKAKEYQGPEHGYILLNVDDRFLLNTKQLDVVSVKQTGPFVLIAHRGPYIYSQVHQYNDLSKEEKSLQERKASDITVNKSSGRLYVDAVIEMLTKGKSLRYLHKLVLKDSPENSLIGYTEIIGSDLRQSGFAHESPYFIKYPRVLLYFKDGTKQNISIMKNHFNSLLGKSVIGSISSRYEKYGHLSEAGFLGNQYVESPYGISIKAPSKKISDIKLVVFANLGYGSIYIEDDSDDPTRKIIPLQYYYQKGK